MIPVHEHTVSLGPEETEKVGRSIGRGLVGGEVVLLRGQLGAGKTVVARGIAMELGANSWSGSPTFSLIHEYDTSPVLYHADMYRLDREDIVDLGLDEYARGDSILLVEWPERNDQFFTDLATNALIEVRIAYMAEGCRSIDIVRRGGASTRVRHRAWP